MSLNETFMPFNSTEIIEPFWAEYSSEASGRDPLGIQYSSVIIYSKMIVGITNVTNRIRYYGFYCWLFDTIAKNITKRNSLSEQIRYTRRAELLLSFIMVKNFPDITGIGGSDFAGKNIKPEISLKAGADWESKKVEGLKVYWQNQSGIFGQYYSAVLRELNLINHPQGELNIYTLTEKGHQLALAYSQNIPRSESDLFWSCVFSGAVDESKLVNLKSFALHLVLENSLEREFYSSMLVSHDDKKIEPAFNRRDTIKLLLTYLSTQKEGVENLSSSFLKENYLKHIQQKEFHYDTAASWYLFELNELLHVTYEHLHASFLYSIQEYPLSLDACIQSLIEDTKKAFEEDNINFSRLTIESLVVTLQKQKLSVYELYDAMALAFQNDDFGETLKNVINLIVCAYLNSTHHLATLAEFAALPENNFNRTGYAVELLNDLVVLKLDLTISQYLKSIILSAINLHMFSSYTKSRIGQSLVHNYMIEEQNVWRLRKTLPNRTRPRLQNAIQYMIDIGWIKRDGKIYHITDSGYEIANKI